MFEPLNFLHDFVLNVVVALSSNVEVSVDFPEDLGSGMIEMRVIPVKFGDEGTIVLSICDFPLAIVIKNESLSLFGIYL